MQRAAGTVLRSSGAATGAAACTPGRCVAAVAQAPRISAAPLRAASHPGHGDGVGAQSRGSRAARPGLLLRHGRTPSRPSTSWRRKSRKDVDARDGRGHDVAQWARIRETWSTAVALPLMCEDASGPGGDDASGPGRDDASVPRTRCSVPQARCFADPGPRRAPPLAPRADAWRRWRKRPGSAPHRCALRRIRGTRRRPIAPNGGDVPHRTLRQTRTGRPLDPGAQSGAARRASPPASSWPGAVPAIHVFLGGTTQDSLAGRPRRRCPRRARA